MTQMTALHLAQIFSLAAFFAAAMFYFVPWARRCLAATDLGAGVPLHRAAELFGAGKRQHAGV